MRDLHRRALAVQQEEEGPLFLVRVNVLGKLIIGWSGESCMERSALNLHVGDVPGTDPKAFRLKGLLCAVVQFDPETVTIIRPDSEHHKGRVFNFDPTNFSIAPYAVPAIFGFLKRLAEVAINLGVDDLGAILKPPTVFVDDQP